MLFIAMFFFSYKKKITTSIWRLGCICKCFFFFMITQPKLNSNAHKSFRLQKSCQTLRLSSGFCRCSSFSGGKVQKCLTVYPLEMSCHASPICWPDDGCFPANFPRLFLSGCCKANHDGFLSLKQWKNGNVMGQSWFGHLNTSISVETYAVALPFHRSFWLYMELWDNGFASFTSTLMRL